MAKQLNVNLKVSADTSAAQQALKSLSQSLSTIQNTNSVMFRNSGLDQAKEAARDLQTHLQNAVNTDTGKLDLNKLSASLTKSNQNLTTLCNNLLKSGSTGQQAFTQLARSIAVADNQTLNLGTKLNGLLTTLKNTARWQISSSILHGFMSTISGAYTYAQKLNKSLTDIQIVTESSSEKMAKFAKEANKAAQALSTTTNTYAKAALIYYQQGLNDQQVKERTDLTIKMANVTGDTAKTVSEQLTAIWNNFDDGSRSLESYIDTITALGAATASSTTEIAEGLEKFAAIAKTVGLSYEYATSALATVVAKTRQSADVVGTAFKTLFARIQDLELGKTLDDGTTLGQYSQALKTIGVNIKDANGALKDMDDILDELGAKWDQIDRGTQVAVAQAVGGTRQYQQLIAILDNWDYMKENLGVAADSEGTLSRQADIYAESWEAAKNRVKASAEQIYSALLDDKFFISLTNGFSKVLNIVNGLTNSLGGVKGILLLISSIVFKKYAAEMPRIITTMTDDLKILFNIGETRKKSMLGEISAMAELNTQRKFATQAEELEATNLAKIAKWQAEAEKKTKGLSEAKKEEYNNRILNIQAMGDEAVKMQRVAEATAKKGTSVVEKITSIATDKKIAINKNEKNAKVTPKDIRGMAQKQVEKLYNNQVLQTRFSKASEEVNFTGAQFANEFSTMANPADKDAAKAYAAALPQARVQARNYLEYSKDSYLKAAKQNGISEEQIKQVTTQYNKFIKEVDDAGDNAEELAKIFDKFTKNDELSPLNTTVKELNESAKQAEKRVQEADSALGSTYGLTEEEKGRVTEAATNQGTSEEIAKLRKFQIKDIEPEVPQVNKNEQITQGISQLASSMMSVAFAIQAIQNLGNIWSDENLTGTEKLLQTFSALAMVAPMLLSGIKSIKAGVESLAIGIQKAGQTMQAATFEALGWIGLIVAAVTALVVIIYKIATAESETEKETKRLKAALTSISESLTELRDEANELESSFSNYENIINTLAECKRGTDEWTKAFKELEQTTSNLLDKYPELLNFSKLFVYDASTGSYIISSEAIEAMEKAKQEAIETVKQSKALLNYRQQILSDEQLRTKYMGVNSTLHQVLYNYNTSNDSALFLKLASMDDENQRKKYFYDYLQNNLPIKAPQSLDDQKFLKNFDKLNKDIIAYRSESQESEAARLNLIQAFSSTSSQELMDSYKTVSSKKAANAIYNKIARSTGLSAYNQYYRYFDSIARNTSVKSEEAQRVQELVFDIVKQVEGVSDLKWDTNWIRGGEGNRSFHFTSKDSTDPIVISAAELASYMAGSRMTSTGITSTKQYMNKYIINPNDLNDYIIGSLLTSDSLNKLTQSQLSGVNAKEFVNSLSKQQRLNLEYLTGINNTEDLEAYVIKAMSITQAAFDSMLSEVPEKIKATFSSFDTAKLTAEQQSSLVSILNKIYGTTGNNGLETISTLLHQIEQSDNFTEALVYLSDELDWTTANTKDLSEKFKDLGIIISDSDLQNFIELMQKMDAKSFKETAAQYAALEEIIKDLARGATISAEEYESLGVSAQDYFIQMADGTYKLIRDAKEFYDIVHGETIGQFQKNVNGTRVVIAELEGLQKNVLDDNGEAKETISSYFNFDKKLEDTDNQDILITSTSQADDIKMLYARANQLLSFLNAAGIDVDSYAAAFNENQLTIADYLQLIKLATDNKLNFNQISGLINNKKSEITSNFEALFSSATNIDDLNKQYQDYLNDAENSPYKTENNKEAKSAYNKALSNLLYNGWIDDENVDTIYAYAQVLKQIADYENLDNTTRQALAASTTRLSDGMSSLTENGLTWLTVLKEGQKGSIEWIQASDAIKAAISDLSRVDTKNLSIDWILEQSDSIVKIMQGDLEALKDLLIALAQYQQQRQSWAFNNDELSKFYSAQVGDNLATDELQQKYEEAQKSGTLDKFNQTLKAIGINITIDTNGAISFIKAFDPSKIDTITKAFANLNAELEEFYTLLRQIERAEAAAARQAKIANATYGTERSAALQRQNAYLQDAINLLKQEQEELKEKLRLQRMLMAANYGATFDEYGNITNYEEIAKNNIGNANFQNDLSKYENYLNLWYDIQDDVLDKQIEIQENYYKNLKNKLDEQLALIDMETQKLEYYYSRIEDDVYSAAEGFNLLLAQSDQSVKKLEAYKDQLDALEAAHASGAITSADYAEGLKEINSAIWDNLEALDQLDEKMREYYSNTLEKMNKELEKYTRTFEHLNKLMDHYSSILALTGGSKDYNLMNLIYSTAATNAENALNTSSAQLKSLQEQMEFLMSQPDQLEEDIEALQKAIDEAEEDQLEKTKAYLEAWQKKVQNSLQQAAADWEETLTNGMTFDRLTQAMSLASQYQDLVYTKTNQVYEAQKRINEVTQALAKTTNKNYQEQLKQFNNRLLKMQKQETLSKNQLALMDAEFKLIQARAAFEDAQNAKSAVRLTRDTEGNYGYVFTANEENLAKAQSDLLDAQNGLYNSQLNIYNQSGESIINLTKARNDELNKLAQDTTLSTEEYEQRRAEIVSRYGKLIAIAEQDRNSALLWNEANTAALTREAWTNEFAIAIDACANWEASYKIYAEACSSYLEEWQEVVVKVTEETGLSFEELQAKMASITKESNNIADALLGEDGVIEALKQVGLAVLTETSGYASYRKQLDALRDSFASAAEKARELLSALSELNGAQSYGDYEKAPSGFGSDSITVSTGGGKINISNPAGSTIAEVGMDKVTVDTSGTTMKDRFSNGYTDANGNKYWEGNEKDVGGGKTVKGHEGSQFDKDLDSWLNNMGYERSNERAENGQWIYKKRSSYDTGGYTGKWGPEGKLATLHEKELVLNKQDTSNILAAVSLIRQIASAIDLQALMQSFGLLSIGASKLGTIAHTNLEQKVEITAQFPNAIYHDEIKEAFDTLINRASQYANRNY